LGVDTKRMVMIGFTLIGLASTELMLIPSAHILLSQLVTQEKMARRSRLGRLSFLLVRSGLV